MADEKTDKDTTPPEGNGTESTGTEEWKAPSKEEWDRVQKALVAASKGEKEKKDQLRQLQAQHENDSQKAVREAAEAAERKFKSLGIRGEAKAAFVAAGLQNPTAERVASLVRQLDLDSITVEGDDVIGLDDQVASIKATFSEMFTTQDKKPPRVSGADKPPANGRALTLGQRIAARTYGQ